MFIIHLFFVFLGVNPNHVIKNIEKNTTVKYKRKPVKKI